MTPEQQASLRASLAKDRKGKKGRPRKQDAEQTGKTNDKKKKSEKKKERKTTKPSKVSKTPLKRKPKGGKTVDPKGRAPPKKSDSGGTSHDTSAKYGCSRCRYASKGCTTCKNPNLKPRTRRAVVDVD